MGRVKLKIKRLENTNGRQATYCKRKHGIIKKATELSILCDIDIILLMFSPTGKPSLCSGKRSIEEVIAKFAQSTPQERAKRKLESLGVLQRTFKKLDHDVNIQEFLGTSTRTINDLTAQSRMLQTRLSEVHRRLSRWTNINMMNSVEPLAQMEDSLRESLNQIRTHKENLQKLPLMPSECINQYQNGIHIPFRMDAEQQLEPFSWITNNENQHMLLPEEPKLIPHRDMECATSCSSLTSYSGFFRTGRSPEICNSAQENGVLHELSRTEPLRPQVMEIQSPYLPYNCNVLGDMKHQPQADLHPLENTVDYNASGSYQNLRPAYETTHHSWGSTSVPYAVSLYDERLYPHVKLEFPELPS